MRQATQRGLTFLPMERTVTFTHRTAIAGITALMAVLLVAGFPGRPEAAVILSPFPQPAERAAGEDAPSGPRGRLTVDQCVEIAFKNSPNILAASHTMNATRSRVGQAWSGYYPRIELNGAYTRSDRRLTWPQGTLTPLITQDNYSWSATLTQNIADFGRTDTLVSIRQRDLDASREDLRDTTGQIVFNVKSAYYGLLRAEKSRDVLRETVMLFEKQLEEAKVFYEAGMRARFDVTNAEVELSNAKLNLVRAENALRTARVTLNNAMGVPDALDYEIEDSLSFQK